MILIIKIPQQKTYISLFFDIYLYYAIINGILRNWNPLNIENNNMIQTLLL